MASVAEMTTSAQGCPPDGMPIGPPPSDCSLPLTVIERRPGWSFVNLMELWRYRELLFFLTWRDIKVRYKQTVLGAVWSILQPLATMLVFSLFLGRVAAAQGDAIPYALFVFAGLLPWTFFANAVNSATNSIVTNQNLVTKIYFPRLIIPIAAVAASLIDFAIACGMLLALMFYYGVLPGWGFLLAPLLILTLVLVAVALGVLLSALTVAYRDFRSIVPLGIQLWMFATPTIYLQANVLGDSRWRALLPLNPLYGLIYNFRLAVLGGPRNGYGFDWYALAVSGAIALGLLLLACFYFRRVEKTFADII